MKIIKYQIAASDGSTLTDARIECTEAAFEKNLQIALREAYNGEYTVEEAEDAPAALTVEERLAALEKTVSVPEYTAGTWYYRGDKVRFEEAVYTCIAPEGAVCVWSPADHPAYWKKS